MAKSKTKEPTRTELQKQLDELIKTHGSLRAVARECGVDPAYLWRVYRGKIRTVSDKTLEKLGFKRVEKLALI